jgi:hypothetical protein
MKEKWKRGNVGRFWDLLCFKKFDYVRQPLMQEEIDDWVGQGYDYVKSFSGSMYDNRNPMPDWVDNFKGLFDYKNMTFTFYKMSPLEIMPPHVDHFNTYMKLHLAEYKNVVRILVMLEDWKPGHYLEIDGVGIVNWVAGDYFIWNSDVPHAASNIGTEDRYSLQISAEKIQSTDVWRKLHWYNIPDLSVKRESMVDPYLTHIREFLHNPTKPYYIYMYNQNIPEFDNINHNEETVKFLNDTGVNICLYEPLCGYTFSGNNKKNKHNREFYSEFTGEELPNSFRADELDSILSYIKRNKLTNVTVHTCDYGVAEHYSYYNDYMKLIYNDLFIKTCRPINVQDKELQNNFNKKFISANWRYTPHRHLIATAVAPLDSYVSWYYKADFHTISKSNWYDFEQWKEKYRTEFDRMVVGTQYLNNNVPLNLDLDIVEPILVSLDKKNTPYFPNNVLYDNSSQIIDGNNNLLEEFYKDIFCDIVTESRYAQPTANFSEKVFQPMWYKKPFVLVAPPYTLKCLREQGFKTFSDFWDESYDEVTSHEERLRKIFEVIDFINNKPIDELRDMLYHMSDILYHNELMVRKTIFKAS